jgi:hypothetical protein
VFSADSAARLWLRALLWLSLGIWIGAMGLFGAMTRVAFEVVPTPEIAGHLVSRLLQPLLLAGAVLGAGLAVLGAVLGRGRLAIVFPLLLSIACLVNQFGVSRAVAEIHLADPGLAPGLAARFATLHQLSVWLFTGTGLGALVLAAIHARIDVSESQRNSPSRIEAAKVG